MAVISPIKVLLVEDNPADALLLQSGLDADRLDTFVLTNVERLDQIKPLLERESFDIILLDLGLPDSQGLETFERCRQYAPDLPIIVSSGNVDEQAAIDAVRAGAQDYLVKGQSAWEMAPRTVRHAIERHKLAKSLQESEKRFRALIENSVDAIVLLDAQGNILYESPALTRITGYTLQERMGRSGFENLHPDDRSAVLAKFAEALGNPGEIIHAAYRSIRKDGNVWWAELTATNLLAEPSVHGIVVNFRDVTERKLAEEKLHFHQALLEETGHIAKVGGWSIDAITGEGFWTDEVARIHDLDPALPTSKEIGLRYYTDDCRPIIESAVDACIEKAIPYDLELEIISAKGIHKWIRTIGHPQLEAGRVVRVFGSFQDITDRKQTELTLQKNERVLRLFVEHSPASIAMFDRDMRYIVASRRYLQDYRLGEQDLTGRSHYEVFPEIPERWKEIHQRCLAGAIERADEDPFPRMDGHIDWVHWEVHPWYESVGRVGGIILFSEVITERKEAAEKLRKSEEQYRYLFENNPHPMWAYDLETLAFLAVNDAAVVKYGYSREEFLGMTIADIRPAEDVQRLLEDIAQPRPPLQHSDGWRHKLKDGKVIDVEISSHILELEGHHSSLVVALDITERKRAEGALKQSEERLRRILETTSDGFWIVNSNHQFIDVNPAYCAMTGYTRDEILGLRIQDLEVIETREEVDAHTRRIIQQGSDRFETKHRRKDGSVFDAEVSVNLLDPAQGLLTSFVRDVTDRKKSESALRISQARYLDLFENSPISVWEEDFSQVKVFFDELHLSGVDDFAAYFDRYPEAVQECASLVKVLDVNRATLTLMEAKSKKELLGTLVHSLNPEEVATFRWELLSLSKGELHFEGEETIRTFSNAIREVLIHIGVAPGFEDTLGKVIVSILDITERKQVEAERQKLFNALSARTADLSLLLEAGHALSETLNHTQIYEIIYRYIKAALPCDILVISSYESKTEMISCEYLQTEAGPQDVSGFPPIHIEPPGQGTQSRVIRSGESLLMPDYVKELNTAQTTYHFNEHAEIVELPPDDESVERARSAIIVPLKVDGKVVGAMQILSYHKNAHTEDHLRFVETLAFHISASLSNARLFAELELRVQERTAEIETIRQRLELATKAAELGIWDWNIQTGELLWDEQMSRNYGIEHEAFQGTLESFMSFVHPDDVNKLMGFAQDAMLGETHNVADYRVIRSDGTTGYVKAHGIVLRDAAGLPQHVVGVTQNITQEKVAELALRESEEQNRLLFEETPDAVILFDSSGRVERMNHAFELLTGIQRADFVGHSMVEMGLLSREDEEKLKQAKRESLQLSNDFASAEIKLLRDDGRIYDLSVRVFALNIQGQLHYLNTMRDITSEKKAEEALRVANAEMARALRLKDEFLANMSHELRTPLNAILGISESLEEQIVGPLNEKQQHYIRTVGESGRHLLALINDILDLSKIEAGRMDLNISEVNVGALVQSSLRMVKELAQKKNLNVTFKLDEQIQAFQGDERRLKQVLVNLLSNAVKFTGENGRISLEVSGDTETGQVTFTISDTGIGIALDDIPRLFQPFVQLDAGLAREHAGTGLGLALVSEIVRLHGGQVTVQSSPGQGSSFFVILPWKREKKDSIGKSAAVNVPTQPLAPTLHAKHGKILLVEDTESIIFFISDYLQALGYQVIVARDGLVGVNEAKAQQPDLILMDIQMPGMNGFDATRIIRSDPTLAKTPIIALTAMAMPGDRERCLAVGMQDYLSKPISLKELAKVTHDYLSKSGRKSK